MDRVKLDSVHERVLFYRAGVGGAVAQRLTIGLAGASDVLVVDCREWDQVDGVDLNFTEADPVAAALLYAWSLPQPHRDSDVSGQDVVAKLAAELHARKR